MPAIKRKYKTFVQRLASAIIDGIVFIPVSIVFGDLTDTTNRSTFIFWSFAQCCTWLVYSVYLHGKYGQTLGKMASSVKVYALDEKSLIGYKRAFLREIVPFGITLIGLAYVAFSASTTDGPQTLLDEFTLYPSVISTILELTTLFLNNKRRALHDLIAGSVVLDITKYKKWDFEYEDSLDQSAETGSEK